MMGIVNSRDGQMTVELAVALPILIIVAVVAFNALQFFSECAQFDRIAHDAVRVYAASPEAGQGADQACAQVAGSLEACFDDAENVEVRVQHASAGMGFDEFTATIDYHPTLFGMGLRSEVLGVSLPYLSHTTRFVVDVYKPGVVV